MRFSLLIFAVVCSLSLIVAGFAVAGVTGKIAGTVKDKETGEPLFPANIIIEETHLGAASLPSGEYYIINVPPGTYRVRAKMMGYKDVVVENVTVRADFTTEVNFELEKTTVAVLKPITVRAERPLIQPDVTATTRFISAEEIDNLPTRGYQEAVFLQTGVVSFALHPDYDVTDTESQTTPSLNIRGGRSNEVAYYVDGFPQQDPLTGISSLTLNQSAIHEITVLTGGFNAEYGRIMSGAVNVITKEGGPQYSGSIEAVTDNLAGDWIGANKYDYNIYDFSLGGPGIILPILSDKLNFYISGERRWSGDRSPRAIAGGKLPGNTLGGWSWQAKLVWKPTTTLKIKLGTLGSYDDWREYRNAYRFNIKHAPRYQDKNYSITASVTHTLSPSTFYTIAGSYFVTDRKRGDGLYFDDLPRYSRPNGNPRYDQFLNLFWNIDDPTTEIVKDRQGAILSGDESHVWDDYLHRNSSYWGIKFDFTSQVDVHNQVKFGFDVQRHTLRYYRHVLPVQVVLVDSTVVPNGAPDGVHDKLLYHSDPYSFVQDADYYGYYWTPVDSVVITPAHWRITPIVEDGDTVGFDSLYVGDYYKFEFDEREIDSGRQAAKHPITASAYIQDKFEYEGVVINAGLRYDYLNVDTKALRDPERPLGEDNATLDEEDLVENDVHHVISPRPVSYTHLTLPTKA